MRVRLEVRPAPGAGRRRCPVSQIGSDELYYSGLDHLGTRLTHGLHSRPEESPQCQREQGRVWARENRTNWACSASGRRPPLVSGAVGVACCGRLQQSTSVGAPPKCACCLAVSTRYELYDRYRCQLDWTMGCALLRRGRSDDSTGAVRHCEFVADGLGASHTLRLRKASKLASALSPIWRDVIIL